MNFDSICQAMNDIGMDGIILLETSREAKEKPFEVKTKKSRS
ncbi:hypothetical protein HMPREF9446_03246 [Bacteroides fluxus YIT 12057]|uniref:Uncharacterized protein n=1 Tax=Bacteroides fluxus YIT 12057 TaxID=763034 RepID=F3PWV9_9BACE|nr:hypothetical protein HMPREF9446_03246 [Bacteroides fluxus YIT 12057]